MPLHFSWLSWGETWWESLETWWVAGIYIGGSATRTVWGNCNRCVYIPSGVKVLLLIPLMMVGYEGYHHSCWCHWLARKPVVKRVLKTGGHNISSGNCNKANAYVEDFTMYDHNVLQSIAPYLEDLFATTLGSKFHDMQYLMVRCVASALDEIIARGLRYLR